MSQPVVEDRYDNLRFVGLAVGAVTGVAMVGGFVGLFGYLVLRSLARLLTG